MIVCLDLETTWFDSNLDEIIEVALIKFDEKTGEVIDTFTSLVNSRNGIPDVVQAITSIDESLLIGAPSFDQIRDQVESFIWEHILLGHNVFFDIWFLRAKWIPLKENRVIDTFLIGNFLYFSSPSLSLESLCKEFWIIQENAHRALDDVKATIGLFLYMKKEVQNLDETRKTLLASLLILSSDKNTECLREILCTDCFKEVPFLNFQDILIATLYKFQPLKGENKEIKGNYKDIIEQFPNYSQRNNQEKLFEIFEKTLWKDAKYVVEAPTWVWKTFSYLVPALKFALTTGNQVIISTKTKLLQDQIVDNDLKKISETLGVEAIVTKLKWKKNYLSLFHFFTFLQSRQFNLQEISFIAKLTFWLLKTKNWELDELNLYGEESLLVDNVNIQSQDVLSPQNPFLAYEFYKKVIEKVNFSHIVVVNHSFVFSDIQKANRSLLTYKYLIFDEAHSLEDIGTESLKLSYNKFFFSSYISKYILTPSESSITSDILFLFDDLEERFTQVFWINQWYPNQEKRVELISPEFSMETFEIIFSSIRQKLQSFKKCILENHVGEFDDGEYIDSLLWFFEKILSTEERKKGIFYFSYDNRTRLSLFFTVKYIGEYLKENIWDKVKSVYLLSATLSIDDDMKFITETLSLQNFSQEILSTDFDYKNQAHLFIPSDLGDIKRNTQSIIYFLSRLSELVKGRMLVLFTSLSTVKQVYLWVHSFLKEKRETHILAQGIHGWKSKILENFKTEWEKTIVFWTDSFWEGVDIPWENLTYLVIHKLPFPVPTDPIFLARSAKYKNAFIEYAVPKTVLKLKQWFGRLIRTSTDTGYIFLLDNRVIETDWGKKFFAAFPKEISFEIATQSRILDSIQGVKNIKM
jgi:ATP-dependent DNA helicase DinG